MNKKSIVIQIIISLFVLIFSINWVNYLIIYNRLSDCEWPKLTRDQFPDFKYPEETTLKAMFVTDVHLRTDTLYNVTENIWREWQMYWTLRLAKDRFRPHAIIILGDIFDDGVNYDQNEFDSIVEKFERIFTFEYMEKGRNELEGSEEKPIYFTVHGNHDIGFHYEMTPELKNRFERVYNLEDVMHFTINGIRFVYINSVTMEGDNCQLCSHAVRQLQQVTDGLCPAQDTLKSCLEFNRPVLLTHYPLYRESEEKCGNDWDTRAWQPMYDKFIEGADCLSLNATKLMLDSVRPRVAFSGHTHVSCQTFHWDGTEEWTIASFNGRYLYTPTILLAKLTKTDYSIAKCILSHEFTFYFWDSVLVIGFAILWFKRVPQKVFRKIIEMFYCLKVYFDKYFDSLLIKLSNYSKLSQNRIRRPS